MLHCTINVKALLRRTILVADDEPFVLREDEDLLWSAPKGNTYATGNKGGKGGPSKYKPEYIDIATRLCDRGLTDAEIAEVLGVSEPTIHAWKLKHEEFALALKRTKDEANAIVEASLFKRANGFEKEVEKVFHTGKRMKVKEYFPPEAHSGFGFRTECQKSIARLRWCRSSRQRTLRSYSCWSEWKRERSVSNLSSDTSLSTGSPDSPEAA
jgi:predicted transcriptional regulator